MQLPKLNLPKNTLPKVNAWKQAVDKPVQEKYTRASPLTPNKDGYPIVLYKGTPPNKGISIDDLETEPIRIVQNTPTGPQIRLLVAKNPYLMKGATEHLTHSNALLEAENERLAIGLTSQWNNAFKLPQKPYAPLLKKNAPEVTEEELSTAISNTELEEKFVFPKKKDK